MRFESTEPAPGEPEDGWVTAPLLVDTQILQLLLCRFTGNKVSISLQCLARMRGEHADVECKTVFLQAEGLKLALTDGGLFPEVNDEIRMPYVAADPPAVAEPIATDHL